MRRSSGGERTVSPPVGLVWDGMLNITIVDQEIVLDHGTGARLSRELVEFSAELLGDVYVGEMEVALAEARRSGSGVIGRKLLDLRRHLPAVVGNARIRQLDAARWHVNRPAARGAAGRFRCGLVRR